MGTKVKAPHCQHLCLRTIGPVSPSRPQLGLCLRVETTEWCGISPYQVLGRAVGVEWARGTYLVKPFSRASRSKNSMRAECHLAQRFEALPVDARGRVNDSDGVVVELTVETAFVERCYFMGEASLVNDHSRVVLGRPMTGLFVNGVGVGRNYIVKSLVNTAKFS